MSGHPGHRPGGTPVPGHEEWETGALGDGVLRDITPAAAADTAVLLLPGAGGDADDFARWPGRLGPRFRLLAARYPRPAGGIVLLARTLADRVRAHVPEPLVVLGHSMGALLAYELAWRLQSLRSPALALYACAAFSPAQYSAMAVDEEALADGARALGLSPPRDEGRGTVVPEAARHDLAMIDAYRYGPVPRLLDYPVTVVTAREDPVVPPSAVQGWAAVSRHPLTLHSVPGGHHSPLYDAGPLARLLCRAHA
ncbi:alpha/beta fold hydrolase [Streptomyces sp. NPDC046215]|uniref:Alpha/beta fold hydrolase n=1 Tax=Streptomyces stramineus TaxID=173861 RepID=A0ABP3KEM1_9ACTN